MAIHKKREDHFVSVYLFVYIIYRLDSYLERILLPLRKTKCFNTQTSRRSENSISTEYCFAQGYLCQSQEACFYGSKGIWAFPAGIKLLVFLLLFLALAESGTDCRLECVGTCMQFYHLFCFFNTSISSTYHLAHH